MAEKRERILLIGEPILDETEKVSELKHVRTVARHSDNPYYSHGRPKSALGGVFFIGRFLARSCSIDLVYPHPAASGKADFADLVDDLARLDCMTLYPIEVGASLFRIRRILKCYKNDDSGIRNAETILRIESGQISVLKRQEEQRVLDEVSSVIESYQEGSRCSAVVLADYDLGLFTPTFLERLGKILQNELSGVPIIVYSGKTWSKFSRLPQSYIVSDYAEALGDLERSHLVEVPQSSPPASGLFPIMAENFSNLRGVVLVNSWNILAGSWRRTANEVEGQFFEILSTDERMRVPAGYRALITTCVALGVIGRRDLKETLASAHKVASHAQLHLIETLRDDQLNFDNRPHVPDMSVDLRSFRVTPRNPAPLETSNSTPAGEIVTAMFCYASEQAETMQLLERYLQKVITQGILRIESDRQLLAGDRWKQRIEEKLKSSDLIVLILSLDFLESDECRDEMKLAIECSKHATVVPVKYQLVPNSGDLKKIREFHWVPKGDLAINEFQHPAKGVLQVAEELAEVVKKIHANRRAPRALQSDAELTHETLKKKRIELTDVAMAYYMSDSRTPSILNYFHEKTGIPVLCKNEWLPETPIEVEKLELHWMNNAPAIRSTENSELLDELQRRKGAHPLFDGDLYRLVDFNGKSFTFCRGKYFDFLRTCESLGWELAKAYRQEGPTLRRGMVPHRDAHDVDDFRSACTAFGTCTLVIRKNEDGTQEFLLNQRSDRLSETPGMCHVIPAGTFQPAFHNGKYSKEQFAFTENIFREFVEELIDDEQIRASTEDDVDFKSLLPKRARNFIERVKEKKKYSLWHLGSVVDPVNLKPEIHTVMILERCEMELDAWKVSWETSEDLLEWREFARESVESVLQEKTLVPTARAHLHLVLHHFDFLVDAVARHGETGSRAASASTSGRRL